MLYISQALALVTGYLNGLALKKEFTFRQPHIPTASDLTPSLIPLIFQILYPVRL